MDTFGEWLQRQRKVRRLTRQEFAARVGCSTVMLRKIEQGERRPSIQIAELIANCLDIPVAEMETLIRAARGELTMERISPISQQIAQPGIIQTQPPQFANPIHWSSARSG